VGCSVVSPGCSNCYAMRLASRLEAMGTEKYKGLTRKSGKRHVWTGKVRLDPKSLLAPGQWRSPRRIFVNSMSDMFHEGLSDHDIESILDVMRANPQHVFQVLTKRADRLPKFFGIRHPPKNLWLGVSVEDREFGVPRIDYLRSVNAKVRFLSCEPLLEDLGSIDLSGIHWVIVGGESGPGARLMKYEWADSIRQQCEATGAAYFFKQWGAWGSDGVRRSKSANGRMLNGRVWDAVPTPV
jgi:protein gp37